MSEAVQVDLFAERDEETTLAARFVRFRDENPHIIGELERRVARLPPGVGFGIALIWESMRYDALVQTQGDAYKLNNDFRSRYARLLIQRNPALAGVLEIRRLRS